MNPDTRKEDSPPKFRAVLPPDLEGVDLDEGPFSEPVDVEEHIASLDARLEALEALEGE
jgi:hypothetical protein